MESSVSTAFLPSYETPRRVTVPGCRRREQPAWVSPHPGKCLAKVIAWGVPKAQIWKDSGQDGQIAQGEVSGKTTSLWEIPMVWGDSMIWSQPCPSALHV